MSNDEDRPLDLGPLRTSPGRHERMVAQVTARALAARRPPSLWEQLTRAAWPLVAAAALVAGAAAVVSVRSGPATAPAGSDAFSEWATQGAVPAAVDLSALALGGER